MEILEFSCPYGYVSHGRNTLERVYEEKRNKYMELARNLKKIRGGQVRVTAIIVSSLGAVYERSLKDLQMVLGCTDKEIGKLGRKMSEAAILGSMEIWRQNAREIRGGTMQEVDTLIEEEVEQLDQEALESERAAEITVELERAGVEHYREDDSEDFEPEDGREDSEFE
jgi:hypothetical protein